MFNEIKIPVAVFLAGVVGCSANAAVTVDEAKQLGSTLTPWGAEKAGNKDGSIPAYTGEAVKSPANYDPKRPGVRPDPFSDKLLFSITAQNYTQYADKLSEGQKEMFKKYSNFRMDIYPSRRTANYPKYIQDNSIKNATACKGDANEERLVGCYGGVPFPIPKTGNQVMWNHLTQYKQSSWASNFSTYVVPSSGHPVLQAENVSYQESDFHDPARTASGTDTTSFFKFRGDLTAPARRAGEKLLMINYLNQVNRAWQYLPGQRRVKLAPDLAYDTPNPQSGGSLTMDDSQIFFGSLDRYDFKLVGKKENYIPYNTYKLHDQKVCPPSKAWTPNFTNPDCMRWELHRVWVVTATLKPTFRHIYPKRTFYYDEDMPGAGTADSYDAAGRIYRVGVSAPFTYYEGPGISTDDYIVNDLATGAYATAGFPVEGGNEGSWHAVPRKEATYYSPEALAGEGIR